MCENCNEALERASTYLDESGVTMEAALDPGIDVEQRMVEKQAEYLADKEEQGEDICADGLVTIELFA